MDEQGGKVILTAVNMAACVVTFTVLEAKSLADSFSFIIAWFVVLLFMMFILASVYQIIFCRIRFHSMLITWAARTTAFALGLNLVPWLLFSSFWKGLPATFLMAAGMSFFTWFYEMRSQAH